MSGGKEKEEEEENNERTLVRIWDTTTNRDGSARESTVFCQYMSYRSGPWPLSEPPHHHVMVHRWRQVRSAGKRFPGHFSASVSERMTTPWSALLFEDGTIHAWEVRRHVRRFAPIKGWWWRWDFAGAAHMAALTFLFCHRIASASAAGGGGAGGGSDLAALPIEVLERIVNFVLDSSFDERAWVVLHESRISQHRVSPKL